MSTAQILTLLRPWLDHWRGIETAWNSVEALTHGDTESPLARALYRTFDAYTDALAQQLPQPRIAALLLNWFIYDNNAGKNTLTRLGRPIRNLRDLAIILQIPHQD